MKSAIILALCFTAALAVPVADSSKDAVIIRQTDDNFGQDGYKHGYETSNGITADAEGKLSNTGGDEGLQVRGQFSYTGDDGKVYTVNYVADENGFKPQGAHLPQ